MRALPDIKALARAKPQRIHKLWEGLGYYTRVRNMQKAAQQIVEQYQGKFPTRFEEVLELPGIGRYTAGAICSIAFDQPKPILDGNVIRVLTRVFGIEGNPQDKEVNVVLWELAERLVRHAAEPEDGREQLRASHLNQSLMELGALICTPRQPQCAACPLSIYCVAFREGRISELPNLPARPPATSRRFLAFVAKQNDRMLVRQRPAGVVNGHLWEFPNIEVCSVSVDLKKEAAATLGIVPAKLEPLCSIKHTITRYRITLDVFLVESTSLHSTIPAAGQWLTRAEVQKLPFTSAHKRILKELAKEQRTQGRLFDIG